MDYAFIYPHLTYCIEVWGSACKFLMEPLFKVQKRIVRIIAGVSYKAHTDPIFTSLMILDLAKIYRYCVTVFMFKVENIMVLDIVSTLSDDIKCTQLLYKAEPTAICR